MLLLISMPEGGQLAILFVLGFLALFIFYLVTLQNTFKIISEENRQMRPGNIWFLLIPFFSFFWQFVVVTKLADSIKAEGNSKNIKFNEERPGYILGIAMSLANCLCLIPGIAAIAAIVTFFCWLLYWLKIIGYKKMLIDASYT